MNKEIIFYIGVFLTLAFIGYNFWLQLTKSDERNDEISKAISEYEIAEQDAQTAKSNAIAQIAKAYGQDKAQKVIEGTIWMDMPMHLLLICRGKPNEIKESNYKGTVIEKWYYGEYINRLGNYKYTLELTLENDYLVGWRDLK
jgi:hypothetical protein